MFFLLSKVFWFFIQPINFVVFFILLGLLALWVDRRRLSAWLGMSATLVLILSVWSTLGAVLIHPLEERFKKPAAPEKVAGIIVLGGGFEGAINFTRHGYELNTGGDRFVEAAILARRYPEAKVVITGGSGNLVIDGEADTDSAPRLLTALGIAPERLVLEGKSRTTYENAVFTREMVQPKPGETWLLVTSAFHMPRSIGLFRAAGFDVTPWPVDYRTSGTEGFGFFKDNAVDTLQTTTIAMKEWIGLLAYWASGRIDSILPAGASPAS